MRATLKRAIHQGLIKKRHRGNTHIIRIRPSKKRSTFKVAKKDYLKPALRAAHPLTTKAATLTTVEEETLAQAVEATAPAIQSYTGATPLQYTVAIAATEAPAPRRVVHWCYFTVHS